MNCRQCQEQLSAYLEGLLEPSVVERVESHLAECSDCGAEFDEARQLVDCLTREGQTSADASLDILVMDRILREQAIELRRIQMQKRIRWMQAGGAVTAAIVLITFAGIWLARPDRTLSAAEVKLSAAEVMAKGAEAAGEVKSIHIRARMRTLPADNFAYIDGKCDLVPIEFWKEFGDPGKWRVEKRGRVAVMDGSSTTMLLKLAKRGVKRPKPSATAFDTDWIHRIASVQSSISDELRSALAKGSDLKLTHDSGKESAGRSTVVVDIQSALEDDDYLKNKFISRADTRRTYHFDRKSGRLEGLEIHLREKDRHVLIFEITEIEYNRPIDSGVFELEIPEGVAFHEDPKVLPDNEKYARMTPLEAARAFFEACGREDWDECRKFRTVAPDAQFKTRTAGLEILHLGEPFQPKSYVGWIVPYELKFKSGKVVKHNIALRKDNPAKRFVVDGGFF